MEDWSWEVCTTEDGMVGICVYMRPEYAVRIIAALEQAGENCENEKMEDE